MAVKEKLPENQKGRKIECSIDNFVHMVAVTKRQGVPSVEFSTAEGNLEREKEAEDTMLDLLQPFTTGTQKRYASSLTPTARRELSHEVAEEKPSDEKLPSVVTDAGQDAPAKDTKSTEGIIGSQPRGNRNVFTHYPKDPNCEVCHKTKTTRARCGIKPKKRVYGTAPPTKFGDLITADHKILNVENESRDGHKNTLVVQDDFHELDRSRAIR